jgi:exosortase
MSPRPRAVLASAIVLAAAVVLYYGVAAALLRDWSTNENYSHGFLIVPLACYFVWERRAALAATPLRPSWTGLLLVVCGVLALAAGTLGAEYFVARVSLLAVVSGAVVFLYGWSHLRLLAFPVAFLLLMIPIPAIVFNQIAFPLQLLASRFGEAALNAASIPVLREGNVIILSNTTLEVAEACSGIRSLISLLTLAIVYGYFAEQSPWKRLTLALASVPVAIAANGVRVAGTGIAAHYVGPEAAQGFFHTFSGWLVFLVAFILLFLVHRLLNALARLLPGHRRGQSIAAVPGRSPE